MAMLATIQTAKNMGAIAMAVDVGSVTKEQVESMGTTFLEVGVQEDGVGTGGYAKVRVRGASALAAAALITFGFDDDAPESISLLAAFALVEEVHAHGEHPGHRQRHGRLRHDHGRHLPRRAHARQGQRISHFERVDHDTRLWRVAMTVGDREEAATVTGYARDR